MMLLDNISINRKARELGFVRDTFEKVCRLAEILDFIQKDALLSDILALKGGTAVKRRITPYHSRFLIPYQLSLNLSFLGTPIV